MEAGRVRDETTSRWERPEAESESGEKRILLDSLSSENDRKRRW